MNIVKRVVPVFLILCILFSMLSVGALAADGDTAGGAESPVVSLEPEANEQTGGGNNEENAEQQSPPAEQSGGAVYAPAVRVPSEQYAQCSHTAAGMLPIEGSAEYWCPHCGLVANPANIAAHIADGRTELCPASHSDPNYHQLTDCWCSHCGATYHIWPADDSHSVICECQRCGLECNHDQLDDNGVCQQCHWKFEATISGVGFYRTLEAALDAASAMTGTPEVNVAADIAERAEPYVIEDGSHVVLNLAGHKVLWNISFKGAALKIIDRRENIANFLIGFVEESDSMSDETKGKLRVIETYLPVHEDDQLMIDLRQLVADEQAEDAAGEDAGKSALERLKSLKTEDIVSYVNKKTASGEEIKFNAEPSVLDSQLLAGANSGAFQIGPAVTTLEANVNSAFTQIFTHDQPIDTSVHWELAGPDAETLLNLTDGSGNPIFTFSGSVGMLSGTPLAEGTYNITVKATAIKTSGTEYASRDYVFVIRKEAVAQVIHNGKAYNFTDLDDAVNTLVNGDTLKLLKDFPDKTIFVAKSVTIDGSSDSVGGMNVSGIGSLGLDSIFGGKTSVTTRHKLKGVIIENKSECTVQNLEAESALVGNGCKALFCGNNEIAQIDNNGDKVSANVIITAGHYGDLTGARYYTSSSGTAICNYSVRGGTFGREVPFGLCREITEDGHVKQRVSSLVKDSDPALYEIKDFTLKFTSATNNAYHVPGSGTNISFVTNIPWSEENATFIQKGNTKIDSSTVPTSYVAVEQSDSGNIMISIGSRYLDTLSLGRHTLYGVADFGTASYSFYCSSTGRTGDNSHIGQWIGALGGSILLLGLAATVLVKKNRKASRG